MNVFELFAKLSLDTSEYDKGLDDSQKKASGFGQSLKKGLGVAAGIAGASVTVAAGAAASLVKSSVDAYADYEQLVGGVETLFGDSAQTVLSNSEAAFKTAGLSMNEYMETSIQSAAALINSLDGDTSRAADLMDLSITDMADNVNKMGTSMEGVQNAYRGFSRGNFTMLDNLALGFAGTKEGMQQLLDKAQELSGVKYDISSYSDIVQAIHVVQTEMGITGTTAKEASETISGSAASMKSAWENLTTGLADGNADIAALTDNLVLSAETAFNNLLPVIERALYGISDFAESVLPAIAEKIPAAIETILPQLLIVGSNVIESLATGIIENLPMMIESALQIILQLAMGIADSLPELIPTIVDVILQIVETLIDNVDLLVDAAVALIIGLSEGLINAIPVLIEKAPVIVAKLVEAVIKNAPKILQAGVELILTLITGIVNTFGKLITVGKDIVESVKNGFKQKLEDAKNWGRDMIENFVGGIKEKWNNLKDSVSDVAQTVKDFLGFSEPKKGPLSNFHTYAPDMMELFTKGIADNEDMLTNQISKSFDIGSNLPVYTNGDKYGIMNMGTNNSSIATIVELLSQLVNKDPIELDVNEDAVFNIVRKKNNEWVRTHGVYA